MERYRLDTFVGAVGMESTRDFVLLTQPVTDLDVQSKTLCALHTRFTSADWVDITRRRRAISQSLGFSLLKMILHFL
jgi:hypothetical protein